MPESIELSAHHPSDIIRQCCYRKAAGDHAVLVLLDPDALVDNIIPHERSITLRTFIKDTFSALGIELAFSGSGLRERGVVIDVDDALLGDNGLDGQQIRFGETWVRTQLKSDA